MPSASRRSLYALDGMNFFLADVRDGLGPYLAIYLVAVRGPDEGWNEASAGLVMTIAGIAGLIAQAPAGGLVDRIHAKRAILVAAAVAVTLSAISLPLVSSFAAVAATQSVAAIAAAVFAPGIAAISLGIVGPKLFTRRVGRNEAFNHGGNALAATIAGLTAWMFGPIVVFWLMAALAALSIGATLIVNPSEIDHDIARGLHNAKDDTAHDQPESIVAVLRNHPALAIFSLTAFTFHLSNAAMLPSVGQLLAREVGGANATSLIAACIVAAQLVMVPVAIVVGRNADRWGHKPIFLVAFAVLAVRGALYTVDYHPAWVIGVQLLDGIGAGIFGALFPVVIASLTRGSGRFNISQGAVATVQGLGAALSATLAGTIIVALGYAAAFLTLAAIALVGLALYWRLMPETAER